jgi:hypothetical protein
VLREGTTLYLEAVERLFGVHRLFAPKLLLALRETGSRKVLDMGSGGGGPVRHAVAEVERELKESVDITLTDLYPNEKAVKAIEALGRSDVRYLRKSINASDPPEGLPGVRSMFACFHHLKPELARGVLERAYRGREAICIFEITDPSPPGVLSCVMMPLYVLLLTPFIRPMTWSQLFFTYVIPVLPILISWDGFVSTLRTYSPKDMEAMTSDLRDDHYHWEIGSLAHPVLPVSFPYAVGMPK